jgi:hypothetical protein
MSMESRQSSPDPLIDRPAQNQSLSTLSLFFVTAVSRIHVQWTRLYRCSICSALPSYSTWTCT